MIRFQIKTLGCKVNQYDSQRLSALLESNGFILCGEGEVGDKIDLIIVNTCCVTESAIQKNKRLIKQIKRNNKDAKIVVFGCWPSVYNKESNELNVDLVINSKFDNSIVNKIRDIYQDVLFFNCELNIINKTDRSRYFIKIQDGCRQFCSYCIIPYTRGKLESRLKEDVIKEIEQAVQVGYEEIILSGVHLGLYGVDLGNTSLVDLIKDILEIKDLGRVRLSSIEITEVNDELIELINRNSQMCKHLHISLQSGCDKILKLMNRPYNTEYFKDRINKIRMLMPNISITTDIIVGFPGENDEDFDTTVEFCKQINFSKIHVFSFSVHEKTPAFKMTNKVLPIDIKNRSKRLRNLSDELEKEYLKGFLNKELDVVVLQNIKSTNNEECIGKTQYYFNVNFTKQDIIGEFDQNNLVGKIVRTIFSR